MIEQKFYFTATNKLHNIMGIIWKPADNNIKGIIQISHGMGEHIFRYKNFAKFLVERGFIVCGSDQAGHGSSFYKVRGFMGEHDGDINMVEDLYKVTKHVKKKFPNLPVIMFAHSMGSFLGRMYAYYYGSELSGVIYSGTKGTDPAIHAGLLITETMIKFGKGMSTSPLLRNLSSGFYNKKFRPNKTKSDWLTKDESIAREFDKDPECGFTFTYYGFRDLFNIIQFISSDEWYKKYPKKLPTLLLSGSNDPVGNFGKGVKEVYQRLKNAGTKNITIKLFKDGRHEMINETNRVEVYKYILNWIEENTIKTI